MCRQRLIFDPIEHKYFLDGVEIPSVTQIIKEVGLMHLWPGMTEAARRGQIVHLACQFLDEDDLNWDSVGEQHHGYIQSYILWKEAMKPEFLEIEGMICNPVYRVAGMRDRRAVLSDVKATIDLKTGVKERWHGYQLSGYTIMTHRADAEGYLQPLENNDQDKRFTLYLRADGKIAQLVESKNPKDRKVFLSAVTVTHAIREDKK